MPAIAQNYSIPQGSTTQVNFAVSPPVGDTLLGAQIYYSVFALIQAIPQQPAVIKKALDNGIQIDDPVTQTFHVDLLQSDTENLVPGNYYLEVIVIDPTGGLTDTTEGVMTITSRSTVDFTA